VARGQTARGGGGGRDELALRRKLQNDDDAAIAQTLFAFGQLLGNERKYAEADAVLREALRRQRRRSANEHPDLADCLDQFAELLRQEGNLEEAERLCREALAMRRKLLGDTHPQLATSLQHLGMVLVARGSWSEAEAPLREAVKIEARTNISIFQALSSHPWLIEVLEHQGRFDEAEATCRDLLELATSHPWSGKWVDRSHADAPRLPLAQRRQTRGGGNARTRGRGFCARFYRGRMRWAKPSGRPRVGA